MAVCQSERVYFRSVFAGPSGQRRSCDSVEGALFEGYVFPHDEAMGGHFAEFWEDAADVLIGIDEGNDDRQLAAGFDKMRGMNAVAAKKACDGMEGDGSVDIFLAQVFEDFEMQWVMVPGIAFGEIDGDLDSHSNPGKHFTTRERGPLRPLWRPGKEHYCRRY